MDSPFPLIIPVFVVLAIVSIACHFGRSQSLLDKWAAENGYRIIRREYRNFFKGPFFWTSAKGQTVYYVTVQDNAGWTRTGWVGVAAGGWGCCQITSKSAGTNLRDLRSRRMPTRCDTDGSTIEAP